MTHTVAGLKSERPIPLGKRKLSGPSPVHYTYFLCSAGAIFFSFEYIIKNYKIEKKSRSETEWPIPWSWKKMSGTSSIEKEN